MKKGMLITLSSLPAGDTEIHHHSMIKRAEFPYPAPLVLNLLLHGKATVSTDSRKIYIHKAEVPQKFYSAGNHYKKPFNLRLQGWN